MKILVHYVDFSTRWDEWIYVTRDETVYTPKDVARLKRSLMLFQEDCCKKSLEVQILILIILLVKLKMECQYVNVL